MKRARFMVGGRLESGTPADDGHLVATSGERYSPEAVMWLPSVVPTKVIGLALNYSDHADELGMTAPEEPSLFFKPISSLVGHLLPVCHPQGVEYMHYEVELAVAIGIRWRNVRASSAETVIAGYTIADDVTARDFVRDFYRPPVRAQGYDSFGPVGPYLVPPDEIPDPSNLELRAFVNGELHHQGNTSAMSRSISELAEYISSFMALEAGDMIWTGTPRGISHVHPGDTMRLEIEGLGALENRIIE